MLEVKVTVCIASVQIILILVGSNPGRVTQKTKFGSMLYLKNRVTKGWLKSQINVSECGGMPSLESE